MTDKAAASPHAPSDEEWNNPGNEWNNPGERIAQLEALVNAQLKQSVEMAKTIQRLTFDALDGAHLRAALLDVAGQLRSIAETADARDATHFLETAKLFDDLLNVRAEVSSQLGIPLAVAT